MRLNDEIEILKSNITYTIEIANEAIPKTDEEKKEFLELSLQCDEKRIEALEKYQLISKNYQNYLGYIQNMNQFNEKENNLIVKTTELSLYDDNDKSKITPLLAEMINEVDSMKQDLEKSKSFISLPSISLYLQWNSAFHEILVTTSDAYKSNTYSSSSFERKIKEQSISSGKLMDRASSDNEKEINDWHYNNIEKLDIEAGKISEEATTLCQNAGDVYSSMYF